MEILQTKTDVGQIRDQNEDVVLALKHPKNKKIKLLLAADGMGGREKGEVAAAFVATHIEKWFQKKDIRTLNNTKKTEQLLTRYVKTLNTQLIKKYGEDHLGTTLIMALINKKETLFLNVGDSRGYIYRKRKLIQISEDDSDVWMYYKYGRVRKDHLRFFSNNSIVNACIGICKELCTITTTIIPNDYDMVFVLTDGVTDNIMDKKIRKIIRKTPKEYILSSLIYEAVYVDQKFHIPFRLKRKYTANYVIPFPGRDNASGAIYIKEYKK